MQDAMDIVHVNAIAPRDPQLRHLPGACRIPVSTLEATHEGTPLRRSVHHETKEDRSCLPREFVVTTHSPAVRPVARSVHAVASSGQGWLRGKNSSVDMRLSVANRTSQRGIDFLVVIPNILKTLRNVATVQCQSSLSISKICGAYSQRYTSSWSPVTWLLRGVFFNPGSLRTSRPPVKRLASLVRSRLAPSTILQDAGRPLLRVTLVYRLLCDGDISTFVPFLAVRSGVWLS